LQRVHCVKRAAAVLLALFAVAGSAGAASPLIPPSEQGPFGRTRLEMFDYLVGVWFRTDRNVVKSVSCPYGQCLWVPWYMHSDLCTAQDLHTKCGVSPTTFENNCLASDELSQVGMVVAMSTRQDAFDQWVATVRTLMAGPSGQALPVWQAKRQDGVIDTNVTSDDASDATARIILALYIAAASPRFPDAIKKTTYRQLGDTLARPFLDRDFVTLPLTGSTGATIANWLAGGHVTAESNPDLSGAVSFAGYFGDVILALVAAYRSTGDPSFSAAARDTAEAYLTAARYDGTKFVVPPMQFEWRVTGSRGEIACTNGYCTQWDDADAPRAVSVCKAIGAARLAGVDLGPNLSRYCEQWLASDGVAPDAYQRQYFVDGQRVAPPQGGYHNNGLGAALNFTPANQHLRLKLDEAIGAHFVPEKDSFDWTNCMGVYNPAFVLVNLGSAIGLDLGAFVPLGTSLYLVEPCRILDTRDSGAAVGGNETRAVQIAGTCGIPATAKAIAGNVTAVAPLDSGWFTLYPHGTATPVASTLSYRSGKTRANNARITLSPDGRIYVFNGGTSSTHMILDVTGYFQ
jgi:hypothetical protein